MSVEGEDGFDFMGFHESATPLFDPTAISNRYYAVQQTEDTVLIQDELNAQAWIQSDVSVQIGGELR